MVSLTSFFVVQTSLVPGEAVPTRQIIGSAEFFRTPRLDGKCRCFSTYPLTNSDKPNPGENGGWLVLFGGPMLWGDFGKKNMETLGEVNHAWEGDAFFNETLWTSELYVNWYWLKNHAKQKLLKTGLSLLPGHQRLNHYQHVLPNASELELLLALCSPANASGSDFRTALHPSNLPFNFPSKLQREVGVALHRSCTLERIKTIPSNEIKTTSGIKMNDWITEYTACPQSINPWLSSTKLLYL